MKSFTLFYAPIKCGETEVVFDTRSVSSNLGGLFFLSDWNVKGENQDQRQINIVSEVKLTQFMFTPATAGAGEDDAQALSKEGTMEGC